MVHEALTFGDILQSKILFYDKEMEKACIDVCKFLRIDNLPGISGTDYFELNDKTFIKRVITTEQKVSVNDNIFKANLVKRFEKNRHNVLFVFEGDTLVGVVHLSDYNSDVVLQRIQDDILSFERKLRQLLLLNGLTNADMKVYFENCRNKHVNNKRNGFYEGKVKKFDRCKAEMDNLGAFQLFEFSDLMDFVQNYGKYPGHKFNESGLADNAKSAIEKLRSLRNMVMHGKNAIDKDVKTSIYSIESLQTLFEILNILRTEYSSVVKKIRNHPDFIRSMELENKSKLEIIHKIHPKALEYFLGI